MCEQQREADTAKIDAKQREQILALARDFPRLWENPNTPDRERKRIARLLLEDVTLTKGKEITLGVRFKGGATTVLTVPLPHPCWEIHRLDPAAIQEIDRLLEHHTEAEIAAILNARGLRTGYDRSFKAVGIQDAVRRHGMKSRWQRLRESGLLTSEEMAATLGTSTTMIWYWRCHGVLKGEEFGTNKFLYYPPTPELIKEVGYLLDSGSHHGLWSWGCRSGTLEGALVAVLAHQRRATTGGPKTAAVGPRPRPLPQ